jgi:hypothetical protein
MILTSTDKLNHASVATHMSKEVVLKTLGEGNTEGVGQLGVRQDVELLRDSD